MDLIRLDTVDGVVYFPSSRLVSIAATSNSETGEARTNVCVLASDDKLFNLIVAGEVDEVALSFETLLPNCGIVRIT